MTPTRMRGELLWFNEERQDGLIVAEDGARVVVLGSGFAPGHLPVGRCAGTPVAFAVADHDGEQRAIDVAVVDVVQGGRARRRPSRS